MEQPLGISTDGVGVTCVVSGIEESPAENVAVRTHTSDVTRTTFGPIWRLTPVLTAVRPTRS